MNPHPPPRSIDLAAQALSAAACTSFLGCGHVIVGNLASGMLELLVRYCIRLAWSFRSVFIADEVSWILMVGKAWTMSPWVSEYYVPFRVSPCCGLRDIGKSTR